MDEQSFDHLTRLLARAGSRRAALGAVLSAGLLGTEIAEAKNRHRQKEKNTVKRRRRRHVCGDVPIPDPAKTFPDATLRSLTCGAVG